MLNVSKTRQATMYVGYMHLLCQVSSESKNFKACFSARKCSMAFVNATVTGIVHSNSAVIEIACVE